MTDRLTDDALRALLADVPKSGLICADYTTDDNPAWLIIPGSCVGTLATVHPGHEALAQLFALAPSLAVENLQLRADLAYLKSDHARLMRDFAGLDADLAAERAAHDATADAGRALADQAAHVRMGASAPAMNIHGAAVHLGPLVDAFDIAAATHAKLREGK